MMKILATILFSVISFDCLSSDDKSLPVEKEEKKLFYKDPVNQYWYCPKCGSVNSNDKNTCQACGKDR